MCGLHSPVTPKRPVGPFPEAQRCSGMYVVSEIKKKSDKVATSCWREGVEESCAAGPALQIKVLPGPIEVGVQCLGQL